MNVVKCANGHFFDGDSYGTCPHCGAEVANGAYGVPANNTSKKKFSWFSDKKKTTSNIVADNSVAQGTPVPKTNGGSFDYNNGSTAGVNTNPSGYTLKSEADDVTVPLFSDDESTVRVDSRPGTPASVTAPVQAQVTSVQESAEKAENIDNSLKNMVRKASANEEGKTMSYFTAAAAAKSEVGGTAHASAPADPVVGWLVCLKGSHFGESFVICSGKNSIGRNEGNKIVLAKENSVSREKHALIVYEPKKRNFYLQPGDGSGLTYLNDDYITEAKLMSSRDIIELGESKFMFVPLCDADFSWEEYV